MRKLLLLLLLTLLPAQADDFAARLYEEMAKGPGNLFFSPYSVQTALAMAAGGAKGDTRAEMLEVLGTERPARIEAPDFREANRVWVDHSLKLLPSYVDFTRSFGAEATRVNFAKAAEAARQTINGWVAKQTAERIQNLLPPGSLKSNTRLVLTNAVYFKDSWKTPFPAERTHPAPFYLIPEGTSQVQLMSVRGVFRHGKDDDVAVAELPYQGDFSMTLILPHERTGLKQFEAGRLAQWLALPQKTGPLEVRLPRFKIETHYSLGDVLKNMGMPLAFDQQQADFSGITGKRDLCISKVFHGGFVEVGEAGTEAAAATAVVAVLRGGAPLEEELALFNADHPFVYAIRHRPTGTVVFLGRVLKP